MAETQHLSILSIDDEPDEHIMLARSLRRVTRFDIDMSAIVDTEEARRAIARREHDVYLVDHRLIGCSGLDLISEAVKAGNPGPFILRTGSDDASLDVESIRAGAVDYLTKGSTSAETLERSLLLAVERSRAIQAERATQEALQRALFEKGEFLATITHEIRSPLTNVIGFAQLLSDPSVEATAEERLEMLLRIIEEGHEMSGLVEDLLASARNEVGQLSVMSAPVDLNAQITQVLSTLTPERRNRIRFPSSGRSVAVGDPVRIRQVIRNLTSNALKYGGELIDVIATNSAETAIIEVRDNGAGLPHAGEDVFGRHRSNPTVTGSNGIGLSLVRELVTLMGGTITYSRQHGWTVFTVELRAALRP